MARLTIYKESDGDNTVVSNLFIDEYMGDANDAQLKVYLYLLRMMNAHLATSVSDIADKFNHTEKEVLRALKYWEKQHLLDLEFDDEKTLVGIQLRDPESPRKRRTKTDSSFIPMPVSAPVAPLREVTALAEEEDSVSEIDEPAAPSFEKPVFTAANIREFKSRENTAQLLFIAESYIGKPLTPAEIKSILFFTDVLHFSDDLIDYLLQYCIDKGKKSFHYIEQVAINWAEAGITTPAEAQKTTYRYDKNYYAIMNALGKSSTPTPKEAEYITRWVKEYCFGDDIIFEACERTVMATDRNRFEYCERILKSWFEQNLHRLEDIAKADAQFKQRKRTGSTNDGDANGGKGGNRFNQFSQNSYDFESLEKKLLSNN